MSEDRTAKVAKRAMWAFAGTLVMGVVLTRVLSTGSGESQAPLARVVWGNSKSLADWGAALGVLAQGALVGVVGITGLLLWNFLFQVANPGTILRRKLDGREPESPLAQADRVRLEGD